ncbi:hypothetical protein DA803_00215 [[Mycoplasma] phocae]|uniref:Uncharacterized protein n=1 Tax=[Mycoplasma] phocae TaxID=142651 RepID=A0A2Z5IQR3_9BACT|nr:lipoprotein 17-related variable surface protein [[Mycoplasma] phocae]AXE60526.1 hypothetical protein DA803_00215 [[Mycoplasma] phocae]
MKKNLKKYLFAPIVLLTPLALIACKVTKNSGDSSETDLKKLTPEKIREKLNNINEFDIIQFNEYKIEKSQIKPSDIIDLSKIIVQPKEASLKDKVKVEVIGIKDVKDSEGMLTLVLQISYDNITTQKDFVVSGFRKFVDPTIDLGFVKKFSPDNLQDYIDSDLYKQFELDNKKYIDNFLRNAINFYSNGDISKWRENIKRDPKLISKYDEIARELHLDDFNSALLKGFALPQKEGNQKKISLYDGPEVPKAPGWSDIAGRDVNKAYGVPRILPNQKYKDYALDTYSVTFTWPDEKKNQETNSKNNFRQTHGTMWTMDFVKRDDGKYPTKWYFGTNMHVADTFVDTTVSISLTNIKKEVGLNTKLPLLNGDRFREFFNVNNLKINDGNKGAANVIFEAKDFLNIDPANYLIKEQQDKYKDFKEMLDFAVIEIDFEKFENSKPKEFPDVESWVKEITHNYANETKRHIKFLSKTYLTNYDKAKFSLDAKKAITENKDNFYIIGYPISTFDWGLDMYEDKDYDVNTRKFKQSLWINGESSLFNTTNVTNQDSTQKFRQENGNRLSSNLGFRTFGDKPGLLDAFIGFPKISNEKRDDFYTKTDKDGKKSYFINFGLEYSPRHFSPEPGASGSVIRNQNNELVAVFHSKHALTNSGLAAAFRSEGYDYKGLYGSYNLPQYDLIYGGGKNQSNSFRQTLFNKYKGETNFKTNLFESDSIPDSYKFNNNK